MPRVHYKVITWWRQSCYCVRSCYCIPKPIPSSFCSSFTEFGRKYYTGRTLLFFSPRQKMYSNLSHTSTNTFCVPPRLVGRKTWRRMLLFWTGAPPNVAAQADEGFPDEFQQTEEKCSKLLNTVFSTSQVIIIVIIIIFFWSAWVLLFLTLNGDLIKCWRVGEMWVKNEHHLCYVKNEHPIS